MTERAQFIVTILRPGPKIDDYDEQVAFIWKGVARNQAEARAVAEEDAKAAWIATIYGRTGVPPTIAFPLPTDRIECESDDESNDDLDKQAWIFGEVMVAQMPPKEAGSGIWNRLEALVREVGMTDPAIRQAAAADDPIVIDTVIMSRPKSETVMTWFHGPKEESETKIPVNALTRRTLSALCAMCADFSEGRAKKTEEIGSQIWFDIRSATARLAMARYGAPEPNMTAALLQRAGLGDLADAIRAQARTAHKEPA